MKLTPRNNNKLFAFTLVCIVVLVVFPVLIAFTVSRFNIFPQLVSSHFSPKERAAFPSLDTTDLSTTQQKIIDIVKQEYALNPPGTKYSEGIEEPWCADFVSWVLKEANAPLSNPHSGSWRIPGTFTLREYYESIEKLRVPGSGYVPKVGDIMLYDNPSHFGQHTNMVIRNEGGIVTTIGGNEPGGIRIVEHIEPDAAGFIGYSEL